MSCGTRIVCSCQLFVFMCRCVFVCACVSGSLYWGKGVCVCVFVCVLVLLLMCSWRLVCQCSVGCLRFLENTLLSSQLSL